MDGETVAGKFPLKLFNQFKVTLCTAGCALARLQNLDAQLAFEVIARLPIQRQVVPGQYPIEPLAQVPGRAANLNGSVVCLDEFVAGCAVLVVGQVDRGLKDAPELFDVIGLAAVRV